MSATDTNLLMAQAVADAIGATLRQVQIWTDAGAIACLPETNRRGRGKKRFYEPSELPIAALIAALAKAQVPIGVLINASQYIRIMLDKGTNWERAALAGQTASFIVQDTENERSFAWGASNSLMSMVKGKPNCVVIDVEEVARRVGQRADR